MVNDREGEHDGLGGNEEGDIGINPSPIIAWQGMRACGISVMWHSDNSGSTIQIIGLLLRPSRRGRSVNSNNITRATKLSLCNSLQRPRGNYGLLARRMCQRDINAATGSLR
jgi:hypothetical protein